MSARPAVFRASSASEASLRPVDRGETPELALAVVPEQAVEQPVVADAAQALGEVEQPVAWSAPAAVVRIVAAESASSEAAAQSAVAVAVVPAQAPPEDGPPDWALASASALPYRERRAGPLAHYRAGPLALRFVAMRQAWAMLPATYGRPRWGVQQPP